MSKRVSKRQSGRERRKKHIRKSIVGTPERPRLTVYRSLKEIYAQLVDDTSNQTIASVSSLSKALSDEIKKAKGKVDVAKIVGKEIAAISKKRKIENVVFDRNGFVFHGRVKALADAAREAGLKF
jgi:large subunit ribosomal protein L18